MLFDLCCDFASFSPTLDDLFEAQRRHFGEIYKGGKGELEDSARWSQGGRRMTNWWPTGFVWK